jgi:DNA-binding NtrC family response regulator
MPTGSILLVDDDEDIRTAGRLLLKRSVASVVTAERPELIPQLLAEQPFDVVILDMNYRLGDASGADGLAWIPKLLAIDPDIVVLAATAFGNVAVAVEAMKRGATDFLAKPWENEKLVASVQAALALRRSRADASYFRRRSQELATGAVGELRFASAAMRDVMSIVSRAAPTDANVLVLGENGTGKELVARAVHRLSKRADEVFVAVDLGTVSEALFESELFGHRRGAFTDARDDRMGRFEAAQAGTLFLDEVGNLPPRLQAKLLTVLERREVTPIGDHRPTPIDVRVISATNLGDDALADDRTFRQDLLYRLNTVTIRVPPLRERPDDVPVLVEHFVALYARKYRRPAPAITEAAMERLCEARWPGNVRELRHAVERAVILTGGDVLDADAFPPATAPVAAASPAPGDEVLNLEEVERAAVEKALRKHRWNVSHAARELGITRTSLYRRMEKYGF